MMYARFLCRLPSLIWFWLLSPLGRNSIWYTLDLFADHACGNDKWCALNIYHSDLCFHQNSTDVPCYQLPFAIVLVDCGQRPVVWQMWPGTLRKRLCGTCLNSNMDKTWGKGIILPKRSTDRTWSISDFYIKKTDARSIYMCCVRKENRSICSSFWLNAHQWKIIREGFIMTSNNPAFLNGVGNIVCTLLTVMLRDRYQLCLLDGHLSSSCGLSPRSSDHPDVFALQFIIMIRHRYLVFAGFLGRR